MTMVNKMILNISFVLLNGNLVVIVMKKMAVISSMSTSYYELISVPEITFATAK